MSELAFQYYQTPLGELMIGAYQGQLCLCDWRYRRAREQVDNRLKQQLACRYSQQTDPVIEQTIEQLEEYFAARRKRFELPLGLVGSDFQSRVWQALIDIPYGETRSYKQLSEQLGNAKAIRAVAAANGANALSIIVPCHRIIGSDGSLVGYAGGLAAKQRLLQLEGAKLPGQTGDLFSD